MKAIYESQRWNVIKEGLPDFLLWKRDKKGHYIFEWREVKFNKFSEITTSQRKVFALFKKLNFPFKIDYAVNYTYKKHKINSEKIHYDQYTRIDEAFNLLKEKLTKKSRKKEIVKFRHLLIFLLRKLGYSFPSIAKILKYKDHTAIIYAYKKMSKELNL